MKAHTLARSQRIAGGWVAARGALCMALTLPPSGQQRRARSEMNSPGGGSPSGSEPDTGAVKAAMASLRREHRQVIVCTFYEHLSADDAAARLGIPVRDVKRRACSALDEIRRMLEERQHATGGRIPGGLISGHRQQQEEQVELVAGQHLASVVRLQQPGDQIISWPGPAALGKRSAVGVELRGGSPLHPGLD